MSAVKQIRWGIIGPGRIARKFASDLRCLPDAQLLAVASRVRERAEAFGAEFNAPRRYADYEALAGDPDVDAVYISTPHSCHAANMILCLQAGKPVLCEKPFTINAREAEAVIRLAKSTRVFLMEAMWMRFLPIMARLRAILSERSIGEARLLTADFGFNAERREGRLFDPLLGGGALLDVGVYPVSFATMVFGSPSAVSGLALIGRTGVDEQSSMTLGYRSGQLAVLHASITTNTAQEAAILGTQGSIKLTSPWWKAPEMKVCVGGKPDEIIREPFPGHGYQFQVGAVMSCLREERKESELMPLGETLEIMKTMDRLRKEWGLKYPME